VGARDLRRTVAALQQAGKTILLTTHYMLEADELCDRVAVIAGGRIVRQGTPAELKADVAHRNVIEIETFGLPDGGLDRLRGVAGVEGVAMEERGQVQVLAVQSRRGPELISPLLAELRDVTVGRVVAREATLEDAYVELVGRA
jgi:ABC-2 type transport system ATP-binding protein